MKKQFVPIPVGDDLRTAGCVSALRSGTCNIYVYTPGNVIVTGKTGAGKTLLCSRIFNGLMAGGTGE